MLTLHNCITIHGTKNIQVAVYLDNCLGKTNSLC